MRTLNLTFKGSLGKKHSLKLNYASGDLDAETVRNAMQEIAQTHLFTKEGENIYQHLFPRNTLILFLPLSLTMNKSN